MAHSAPGITPLRRHFLFTAVLALLASLSILIACTVGSVTVDFGDLWHIFTGAHAGLADTIVLQLRLPRALTAFAVGGLLSLAGALLQVLLRNPLADPYILGVSGGAAAAALGALFVGLSGAWISGSAGAGALLSAAVVFGLSHARGSWSQTRLLLTGVVVAAGWGAVISFMLALSPDNTLQGMLFWLMGDLSRNTGPITGNLLLAAGLIACLPFARALNLLARGELNAAALGENVTFLRTGAYVVASLLTASAVTLAGGVGFVGLIVPHLMRLSAGNDHRTLLPNAVLFGGTFLVLADTLARTVLAPRQLPVGVITALLGVPIFLFLLQRAHRSQN